MKNVSKKVLVMSIAVSLLIGILSINNKEYVLNNQIWLSNMKCVDDKFEWQLEITYSSMNLNFNFLEDLLREEVENKIEEIISTFYISCFCESVQKDIMWSQYANNHKGFCIEYY